MKRGGLLYLDTRGYDSQERSVVEEVADQVTDGREAEG